MSSPKVKHPVYVYVKRMGTGEILEKIVIRAANLTERHLEKMTMGLMRNMDLESYYVDDDEAVAAAKARKANA